MRKKKFNNARLHQIEAIAKRVNSTIVESYPERVEKTEGGLVYTEHRSVTIEELAGKIPGYRRRITVRRKDYVGTSYGRKAYYNCDKLPTINVEKRYYVLNPLTGDRKYLTPEEVKEYSSRGAKIQQD